MKLVNVYSFICFRYQSGRKAPVLQGGDIRRVKAGSFVAQRIAG